MKRRIWRMHTGSAPGCQDTPRQVVRDWFGNEKIRVGAAAALFAQMLELQAAADEADEEHRCFNRREYALDVDDVRQIIRELKKDKD